MFVYQFDNRCLAFFICHFLQLIFLIDLWGRKMLCFGWLCPLYAGGLSLPVGGFFSGFSMVDSTNFLLKPKFFKNFLSSVFYLRTEITNFVPKKKTL